jgi:hypothetical protein
LGNNIEYDIDALKQGIEKAKKNIEVFETAIQGEHDTIRDYRRMISTLEEKKALNGNTNGRKHSVG